MAAEAVTPFYDFKAECQRDHAEERGERGHQDGTHADLAGLDHGFEKAVALRVQDAGELDNENGVGDDDAGHHDDAHQRHDIDRRVGHQQKQNHAGHARRDGQQNDQRINK